MANSVPWLPQYRGQLDTAANPIVPTPLPRYAIVTGSASGIGRALAERLIAMGYRVAVVDRDRLRLEQAAAELGDHAHPVAMDVADGDAWPQMIARLRADWPRVDLLVNNAGVLAGGELHHTDGESARSVIDINLGGTLLGCHAVVPWLIESRHAAQQPRSARGVPRPGVVNIASIFAELAPPGFAAYNASKAGVVTLSESLRGELQPHGLNVTVALPGVTPTGLFERATFATSELREVAERYQSGAELTAGRVADAVLDAAARGRRRVVVGARARRYAWLLRIFRDQTLSRVAAKTRAELGLPAAAPASQNGAAQPPSQPTTTNAAANRQRIPASDHATPAAQDR